MSASYDIDHEMKGAIDEALCALLNVPVVGEQYDQQHSDTHMRAYLRLKEALEASNLADTAIAP